MICLVTPIVLHNENERYERERRRRRTAGRKEGRRFSNLSRVLAHSSNSAGHSITHAGTGVLLCADSSAESTEEIFFHRNG